MCPSQGGVAGCVAGTCAITCSAMRDDCNANLVDGCETDLAADPARRTEMGRNARAHVRDRFAVKRLVEDVDRLYGELVALRQELPAGAADRDNLPPS